MYHFFLLHIIGWRLSVSINDMLCYVMLCYNHYVYLTQLSPRTAEPMSMYAAVAFIIFYSKINIFKSLKPSQSEYTILGCDSGKLCLNKLCAWRHNKPPPAVCRTLRHGRCGPAAAHSLRLRRPARLASNSCGRHEY